MTGASTAPATLDEFAAALQERRLEAGAPSFAQIAARISAVREACGVPTAAAQVARSSVYDVFRTGRRRVNADLVAEIVLALGGDEHEAEVWRTRCLRAQAGAVRGEETNTGSVAHASTSPADGSGTGRSPVPPAKPAPSATPVTARGSRGASGPARRLPPPTEERSVAERLAATPEFAAVVMVAAISINMVGGTLANRFDSPFYFDTIGTAVAAVLLGPWRGAAVGLLTNAFASLIALPETIVFGLVNAAAGLAWGYGARLWRADRSFTRFLGLSMLVAGLCTLIGAPINVLMYHGQLLHSNLGIHEIADNVWRTVTAINLSVSIGDKLMTAVLAYAAISVIMYLHAAGRARTAFPTSR
ncbi:hypothetical protein [Microbacterium sp. GXF7504]